MTQQELNRILEDLAELDRRKVAALRRARRWKVFAAMSERVAELVRIGTLLGPLLALFLAMTPMGHFLPR